LRQLQSCEKNRAKASHRKETPIYIQHRDYKRIERAFRSKSHHKLKLANGGQITFSCRLTSGECGFSQSEGVIWPPLASFNLCRDFDWIYPWMPTLFFYNLYAQHKESGVKMVYLQFKKLKTVNKP
jgi:hypothetical protein